MNIDEMIAVLTAYKEGKKIQVKITSGWVLAALPNWDFHNNTYRVLSEPKLIPFDYNDDLVGKVVKHKKIESKSLIVTQDAGGLTITSYSIDYFDLLKDYTFLDGKPCGKYE